MTATSAEQALEGTKQTTLRLETLKNSIEGDVNSSPKTLGKDDGVYTLHAIVSRLYSRVRRISEHDTQWMHARNRERLVQDLLPFINRIVNELESLWYESVEVHGDQLSAAKSRQKMNTDEAVEINDIVSGYLKHGGKDVLKKAHADINKIVARRHHDKTS